MRNGRAQKHRVNHRDIERCLNNLNQAISSQLKLQKPSPAPQPGWINQGKNHQIKHTLRSNITNNSQDYQALNNAILTLSKGDLKKANLMLNNIINRLIKTNSDPNLVKRLQNLNQQAANQSKAPTPQPDPNTNAGLLLAIELGMSALAQQQTAEMAAAEEAYATQVAAESDYENEQLEEKIEESERREEEEEEKEETLKEISEGSSPTPQPGSVEYFDEKKEKEAKSVFSAGKKGAEEATEGEFLKKEDGKQDREDNKQKEDEEEQSASSSSSPTPSPGR